MSSPTEQQAEGTWKVFKGKVQEAWGALSGDCLVRFEGRRERTVRGRVVVLIKPDRNNSYCSLCATCY